MAAARREVSCDTVLGKPVGLPSSSDCNDLDPTVKTPRFVVTDLMVVKNTQTGGAHPTRDSKVASAGSSTKDDVVGGLLSDLRGSGTFAAAICRQNDVPDTPYEDPRTTPPVSDGWYYLARGQNSFGNGTYGDSVVVSGPRQTLEIPHPAPDATGRSASLAPPPDLPSSCAGGGAVFFARPRVDASRPQRRREPARYVAYF